MENTSREFTCPKAQDLPYLSFDPHILLGDSLGLVLYAVVAESYIAGKEGIESSLYVKYQSNFPGERHEHSADVFSRLVTSIKSNGYDYMFPVSAVPQAFIFSNGAHRMGTAIALGIQEVPYLYAMENNQPGFAAYPKIFSELECRWLLAQQQRLINELPREKRLLCTMRQFLSWRPESFRDAPFSSIAPVRDVILPYQGLEKIGLTGKRSAEKRFSIYRLANYFSAEMEVLETGCNCGFLSWLVAQRVKHVDAFDVDANYISLGSMLQKEYKTENLNYSVSRFENFVTDKQYDAIISCAVYGWVPIPFAVFVEKLDRWLKPGGILLFESHELIVHPEWKQQRALLTDKYELLYSEYIDDVDHAFYASEYREFLVLKKK